MTRIGADAAIAHIESTLHHPQQDDDAAVWQDALQSLPTLSDETMRSRESSSMPCATALLPPSRRMDADMSIASAAALFSAVCAAQL